MLDINIWSNPLKINLRFSDKNVSSSNQLALEYIEEFNQVLEDINKIVRGGSVSK